jgi:hypothetical protein
MKRSSLLQHLRKYGCYLNDVSCVLFAQRGLIRASDCLLLATTNNFAKLRLNLSVRGL